MGTCLKIIVTNPSVLKFVTVAKPLSPFLHMPYTSGLKPLSLLVPGREEKQKRTNKIASVFHLYLISTPFVTNRLPASPVHQEAGLYRSSSVSWWTGEAGRSVSDKKGLKLDQEMKRTLFCLFFFAFLSLPGKAQRDKAIYERYCTAVKEKAALLLWPISIPISLVTIIFRQVPYDFGKEQILILNSPDWHLFSDVSTIRLPTGISSRWMHVPMLLLKFGAKS